MKAKDLMIGDWICSIIDRYEHIEKKYVVVTGIRTDTDDPLIQCNDTDVWYPVDSYKPIPITPKILQANEFDFYEHCLEWEDVYRTEAIDGDEDSIDRIYNISIRMQNDWFVLDIHNWGTDTRLYGLHIKYVHELQHALKLCEIDKEIKL